MFKTFFVQQPFEYPPDAGAGSGGGSPSSSSEGGAPGAGAGDNGGGGNAPPSAYRLTDDSLVDLGDGKPVKWSEARSSRFMDRASYDRGVEFLTTVAKQLEQAQQPGQRRPGQQPQSQQQGAPAKDLFEGVEDLAVVDGRTLAKIGRQMTGPLGQLITQMAGKVQALEGQLQKVGKTAGVLAEGHQTREFDTFLNTTLDSLPEIKGIGRVPSNNEFVQELARDVFLSHDQSDPNLMREFPQLLQKRMEGLYGLFLKMQKDAAEAAKERKRNFFKPGGQGSPTGAQGYKHLSGAEIAQQFFGSSEAAT